jgi:hypothetical protein
MVVLRLGQELDLIEYSGIVGIAAQHQHNKRTSRKPHNHFIRLPSLPETCNCSSCPANCVTLFTHTLSRRARMTQTQTHTTSPSTCRQKMAKQVRDQGAVARGHQGGGSCMGANTILITIQTFFPPFVSSTRSCTRKPRSRSSRSGKASTLLTLSMWKTSANSFPASTAASSMSRRCNSSITIQR